MRSILRQSDSKKTLIVSAFIVFTSLFFVMDNALHIAFSYLIELPVTMEELAKAESLSNTLLIANYLAIAVAMTVWALIGRRVQKNFTMYFRISAGLAAVFAAAAFFTNGTPAYICNVGIVLSSASALGLLLCRLTALVPPGRAGLFVGCGLALTGLISFFMFSSPFWDARLPLGAFIALMCVFAVLAAACIRLPSESAAKTAESSEKHPSLPMPPKIIVVFILILLLCTMISDIMDEHLFYFYEVFYEFPNFGYIIYIIALAAEVFTGFLFDKRIGAYGFLTGFLFLGVSQAMALFFGETPLMGVPYYVFEQLGSSVLMVFLIATPVYYSARVNDSRVFPQLGFICRNACALAVLIGFQLIMPEQLAMSEKFSPALGVVLLMTLLGIVLSFVYMSAEERRKRDELERRLSETPAKIDLLSDKPLKEFGFTGRETEVLRLLLEGADTADIAKKMVVTEKTVQNYVSALLSKTGAKSRLKLVAMFNRPNR